MKLSIRTSALLMILVPMLVASLCVSAYFTRLRVSDARAELESRGVRESSYLADASELPLLVGDSESLQRLAASTIKAPGAAVAVLIMDNHEKLQAAAGSPREIDLAQQCWKQAGSCQLAQQRHLFDRVMHASRGHGNDSAFQADEAAGPRKDELLGRVILSFDPMALAANQRSMLLNSLSITLAAMLFAAILAQLFARRLSVPMQNLSTVVARIRAGELGARTAPRGAGELRELEEGVNAMADRVEAASADLSRRIDEATAELSRALLDLGHRNEDLDHALELAEGASRAKDLFLARMSHELRTPLTTVIGYTRLLRRAQTAEQRSEFGRAIDSASAILLATVDDILDFVKFESDEPHLEQREFELEACIEDAVMMLAPAAHRKGLCLISHLEAGLPFRVLGDSLRLSQVLSNLISNAIKFTESGSVVVKAGIVSLTAQQARVIVQVSDTGIGISEDNQTHLFKPFVQADESMTRRFGGSGLGLAISARIVAAFGGTIGLSSQPGSGTTARVELPLPVAGFAAEDDPRAARDVHIVLQCAADSPHRAVLTDYLSRVFVNLSVVDARTARVPAARYRDADLLLVVNDRGPSEAAADFSRGPPIINLRPVDAMSETGYLRDTLPLPVRRRELLRLCMARLSGSGAERIAEPVAFESLTLRVLVVEDNELNRRMIATQLRDMGVRVGDADGGDAALSLLASESFDLVLMDVHMPGMDGITLAGQIRARVPELPVYALTANVIGNEEDALREQGIRDILYKPLNESRLLEVLRRHRKYDAGPALRGGQPRPSHGISSEEIETELRRLREAVASALDSGFAEAAIDAAHQLHGAARSFTTGDLAEHCAELERMLRVGRLDEVRACLLRIGLLDSEPG